MPLIRQSLATALLLMLIVSAPLCVGAQTIRIGVFGLFRPGELEVWAAPGNTLVLHAGQTPYVLEGERSARLLVAGERIAITVGTDTVLADSVSAGARDGGAAEFTLSVIGRIRRRFSGTLQVSPAKQILVPVVAMDLETAVASVVAAESPAGAPAEALKAQAIVTRSYFVAGSTQHRLFEFCDTTHCQFLRAAPSAQHPASVAARATRGLILSYERSALAAMYSARCGGRTRSLHEIGVDPRGYPYYAVECSFCRSNPQKWRRTLPVQDAGALRSASERSRLSVARKHGWDAVPSNSYEAKQVGSEVVLNGHGAGHGVGLCQLGAAAMAAAGAKFQSILEHYYPNTAIAPWNQRER